MACDCDQCLKAQSAAFLQLALWINVICVKCCQRHSCQYDFSVLSHRVAWENNNYVSSGQSLSGLCNEAITWSGRWMRINPILSCHEVCHIILNTNVNLTRWSGLVLEIWVLFSYFFQRHIYKWSYVHTFRNVRYTAQTACKYSTQTTCWYTNHLYIHNTNHLTEICDGMSWVKLMEWN